MCSYSLIIYVSFFITILYSFTILRFLRGWNKIRAYSSSVTEEKILVSVIIPFRNERENIEHNFFSLLAQDYPPSCLEIIYVNDHSDDGSAERLQELTNKHSHFRVIDLEVSRTGKKAALLEGVKVSGGELVLFTDADSFPVRTWVNTMAAFFIQHHPVMISGPVIMSGGKGFFSRFQALEFLSLVGSGAGSFGMGHPVMCNGANLGYDRVIYLKCSHKINQQVPSGDDIFMMLSLKQDYKSRMRFIKSTDAIVYTNPVNSLKGFFTQRMRWVSKTWHYRDFHILITALTVFGINVLILGLAGVSCVQILIMLLQINRFYLPIGNWAWNPHVCSCLCCVRQCMGVSLVEKEIFFIFPAVFFIKILIDFLLLRKVSVFFGRKKLLKLFFPSSVLYPVYSVFSALAGMLVTPGWKGRKPDYEKSGIK